MGSWKTNLTRKQIKGSNKELNEYELGLPKNIKSVIPTHCGKHKKSARHGRQDANFDFFNTPCTGTRLQKSDTFSNGISMVFKSLKMSMHFLHTSSILSVSFFWNCKIGARQTLRSLLFREQRRLPLGRCWKNQNSRSYGRRTNFFCAPRLAWGCHFCRLMRILERESQFWWWQNLETAKKMLLSRGFGASRIWKSRARKNC